MMSDSIRRREGEQYMVYKCVIMGSVNERYYATRSLRSAAVVLAAAVLDAS